MKISLLTIVSVLLLLHEMKGDTSRVDQPSQPWKINSDRSRYDEFVRRHILEESFNRNNHTQWRRYLVEKQLCGRARVQSFIDEKKDQVSQVCHTSGKRVANSRNLCISKSTMTVYHVRSGEIYDAACLVTEVTKMIQKVVLGCNKVEKASLPVHYEEFKDQTASDENCS